MVIVELARHYQLNIWSLFFNNLLLNAKISLSCSTKAGNFIIIQRFKTCFVSLDMKFDVLVQMHPTKMVWTRELIKLFQIVFERYFLVLDYPLSSGLLRSFMYCAFKMHCHIVVRMHLLLRYQTTIRVTSRCIAYSKYSATSKSG